MRGVGTVVVLGMRGRLSVCMRVNAWQKKTLMSLSMWSQTLPGLRLCALRLPTPRIDDDTDGIGGMGRGSTCKMLHGCLHSSAEAFNTEFSHSGLRTSFVAYCLAIKSCCWLLLCQWVDIRLYVTTPCHQNMPHKKALTDHPRTGLHRYTDTLYAQPRRRQRQVERWVTTIKLDEMRWYNVTHKNWLQFGYALQLI